MPIWITVPEPIARNFHSSSAVTALAFPPCFVSSDPPILDRPSTRRFPNFAPVRSYFSFSLYDLSPVGYSYPLQYAKYLRSSIVRLFSQEEQHYTRIRNYQLAVIFNTRNIAAPCFPHNIKVVRIHGRLTTRKNII